MPEHKHKIGIGIVGSGFIAAAHAESFASVPEAELRAVASPTAGNAERFAAERGIPVWTDDYRRLVERDDVAVVLVAAPNDVHHHVVLAAAAAGKHVICEKPLARTLAEADEMIAACAAAGVKLMYGEELCFSPKYVRAKALIEEGALGRVFMVRHGEQHDGPHAEWFWDAERAGGGALMDMGCHSIEFFRWLYGRPEVESVTAELGTFVNAGRTRGDDHAIVTVRFAGNRVGLAEVSWARQGGLDNRAELIGSEGVTYVDVLRGSSLLTYSEAGYDYAVEKSAGTAGWSHTAFEESWQFGLPQEMRHFVRCVAEDREPEVKGEDGRAVLEIIYAMYRAASVGRVELPLQLTAEEAARPPIDQWSAHAG